MSFVPTNRGGSAIPPRRNPPVDYRQPPPGDTVNWQRVTESRRNPPVDYRQPPPGDTVNWRRVTESRRPEGRRPQYSTSAPARQQANSFAYLSAAGEGDGGRGVPMWRGR